jgi:hypothetical protein
MKVIYIAGPYRAESEYLVRENIMRADRAAQAVWASGGVALCPHKNTMSFGGFVDDEVFLKGDIELLRRCDAVYTVFGWEKSLGALNEVEYAKNNGIQVFHEFYKVLQYLQYYSEQD